MLIYHNEIIGTNKYYQIKSGHGIPKKAVDQTTSSVRKKLSKRNLKFLQTLGLRVKQ